MLTSLTKTILRSLTCLGIITSPVLADSGIHREHMDLLRLVSTTGTSIYINDDYCYSNGNNIDGVYAPINGGHMLICQDNSNSPGKVVDWTPNDYDTIRHEVHHMVQDCKAGVKGDSELEPVFVGDNYRYFINSSLTPQDITRITLDYRSRGASDDVLLLELEAFSVARSVPASIIANSVRNSCF